jgi:hypothetical protein
MINLEIKDEKEKKLLLQLLGHTVNDYKANIKQHRMICPDGEDCEGERVGEACIRLYDRLLKEVEKEIGK